MSSHKTRAFFSDPVEPPTPLSPSRPPAIVGNPSDARHKRTFDDAFNCEQSPELGRHESFNEAIKLANRLVDLLEEEKKDKHEEKRAKKEETKAKEEAISQTRELTTLLDTVTKSLETTHAALKKEMEANSGHQKTIATFEKRLQAETKNAVERINQIGNLEKQRKGQREALASLNKSFAKEKTKNDDRTSQLVSLENQLKAEKACQGDAKKRISDLERQLSLEKDARSFLAQKYDALELEKQHGMEASVSDAIIKGEPEE